MPIIKRTQPAGSPPRPTAESGDGAVVVMENVTGFEPSDMNELAPDHLADAMESFSAPPPTPDPVEIDPLGALSVEERHEQDDEIAGIAKAKRDAEALLGVFRRR
ncbi:MAG: hypothetical protein JWM60_1459 [Solirubrobacterales bacterium]|nr:hypothetical protein [Solirubrobacterales bacterium]